MKTIQNYLAPEITLCVINTEGILCESGLGGNVADGGELDDNSWDYSL